MGLTHFPHGVTSFGIPQLGGSTIPATTGNVFFVDSGATNASDGNTMSSPTSPGATIDAAIGKCSANNGDQILVMPGHSESLTTATGVAMDVAGVSVFGLGQGNSRPQLVYDHADGAVAITASNCRWSNIVHVASIATVTNGILLDGGITNVEIDHCKFTFDATGVEFTVMIKVGSGAADSADEVIIRDNWFRAENIDGCASALLIDDCDDVHILNNLFTGDFNSVCIDGAAASSAMVDAVVIGNIVWNKDDAAAAAIDLPDAATGIAAYNIFCGANATAATNVDLGALQNAECYVTDTAADVHAVITPAGTAA